MYIVHFFKAQTLIHCATCEHIAFCPLRSTWQWSGTAPYAPDSCNRPEMAQHSVASCPPTHIVGVKPIPPSKPAAIREAKFKCACAAVERPKRLTEGREQSNVSSPRDE